MRLALHPTPSPRTLGAGIAPVVLCPAAAQAAEAQASLTQAAQVQLQAISFLIAAFLVLAMIAQALWNAARRDFPSVPRLSYPASVGLAALCGLLLGLALQLDAGARAWTASPASSSSADLEVARRRHLEALREALWQYARSRGDGRLPPHEFVADIPEPAWQTPHPSRVRYVYAPGRRADVGSQPVAYEPPAYGAKRFVLFADGRIETRRPEEVEAMLTAEAAEAEARARGPSR